MKVFGRKIEKRSAAINFTLFFLSILVVLAGFEIVLRAELFPHTIKGNNARIMCSGEERGRFHPVYGWTEKPNAQYLERMTTQDDWSLHTYNEEGFRDTYDSGSSNIIVMGDSFTRGTLVGDNETFSFLLDAWTPNTSFHNYGMVNYGTNNELALYKDIADDIDHEAVILGYFPGNDMKDNVDRNPKRPLYSLQNGTLVLSRTPQDVSSTNASLSQGGGLIRIPAIQRLQDFLRQNSATYRFINRNTRILLTTFFVYSSPPTGEELQKQLMITEALVNEIGSTAEQHDADLFIVAIPPKAEVRGDVSQEGFERYWNAQKDMLQAVAGRNPSIHYLDLASTFSREENPRLLYGEMDAHMNENGHRITAKAVHELLLGQLYLNNETVDYERDYSSDVESCP